MQAALSNVQGATYNPGALTFNDFNQTPNGVALRITPNTPSGVTDLGTLTTKIDGTDKALFSALPVRVSSGEWTVTVKATGASTANDNKLIITSSVAGANPLEISLEATGAPVVNPVLKTLQAAVTAAGNGTLTGSKLVVPDHAQKVVLKITAKTDAGAAVGTLTATPSGTDVALITATVCTTNPDEIEITFTGPAPAVDNKITIHSDVSGATDLVIDVIAPPVLKTLKASVSSAGNGVITGDSLVVTDHAQQVALEITANDEAGAAIGTLTPTVAGTDKGLITAIVDPSNADQIILTLTGAATALDNTVTVTSDVANAAPLVLKVSAPLILKTLKATIPANGNATLTGDDLAIPDHAQKVLVDIEADNEAGADIGTLSAVVDGTDKALITANVSATEPSQIEITLTGATTAADNTVTISSSITGATALVLNLAAPAVLKTIKPASGITGGTLTGTASPYTLTIADHTAIPASGVVVPIDVTETGADYGTLTITPSGADATANKFTVTSGTTGLVVKASDAVTDGKVVVTSDKDASATFELEIKVTA